MRALVIGLALSLILAGTAGARSIDCLKAATDIERAICANNYLRHHDSTMSRAYATALRSLPPDRRPALADEQRRWLVTRDAACAKLAGDRLYDCLQEQYSKRVDRLKQAAFDPGDRSTLETLVLAGHKLSGGQAGHCMELREVDRDLVPCNQSLALGPVYRSPKGDAAIIAVYTGGQTWRCFNFPVYLVSAKPGAPLEVTRVLPSSLGGRTDCPIPQTYAAYDGIVVEFEALPYQDGGRYLWSPGRGLHLETRWPFPTRPGTTMATGPFWNEQLVTGLRALLGTHFSRVAEVLDHLPIHGTTDDNRFVLIADCYAGRMSHFCAVEHSVRVIFDRRTQRFFVATGKGHSFDASDKSVSFFPPASQWPPAVRKALDAFHGEIKWRGDDSMGYDPDPAPPSVLDYRR